MDEERLPDEDPRVAEGAVALVTGENTGVGNSVADQLLGRGVPVRAGSRDPERGGGCRGGAR